MAGKVGILSVAFPVAPLVIFAHLKPYEQYQFGLAAFLGQKKHPDTSIDLVP